MLQALLSIDIKEDVEQIDFTPIDLSYIVLKLGSADFSLTDI